MLHEDGRTERYIGNKRHIFVASFRKSSKERQREGIFMLFGGTERRECYIRFVTAQHILCTDSLQCATELY